MQTDLTQKSLSMPISKRNYGVDFLRVVSMLMVVILHILKQGGVLPNLVPFSYRYEVAWFLEIASYCAVNCYAIISGYVAINSKFKYSNVIYIWLQVAFYNVGFTVLLSAFYPDINLVNIIKSFLPVSFRAYWYFTAYFCMYFFTPLINKGFNSLTVKQQKAVAVALIGLFSVIPLITGRDVFLTDDGYSAIWLIVLYILGGIIKKCDLFKNLKTSMAFLLYFAVILITWIQKFYVDYHNINFPEKDKMAQSLINYTSPTILFAAVFLLIGFSKLNMSKVMVKIIKVLAPVSFGVYLIHVQPFIWRKIMKNLFVPYAKFNTIQLFFAVLSTAVLIYLLCGVVEYLREKFFGVLRIKKIIEKLENKVVRGLWKE